MILDVGCGSRFVGDVNCDRFVVDVGHRDFGFGSGLVVKSIPNFVVCDAGFLPFVDGCFDKVVCRQVIEHCVFPFSIFCELVRVSCGVVVVETVHRYGEAFTLSRFRRRFFRLYHVSKFDFEWFASACVVVGCRLVRSYVVSYVKLPFEYLPWFVVPYEIGVEVSKN